MINKIMVGFVMLMFILPMVMATEIIDERIYVKQAQNSDIKIPVYKSDNSPADNTITCTITISNDQRFLIQNGGMSFNTGGIFNYTILAGNLTEIDVYDGKVDCDDNSDFGFGKFIVEVNPSGLAGFTGFFFLIIILSYGVVIFGAWKRDITISLLGTLALYFVGIWMLFFGIESFKNFLTDGFAIITLGLAAYLSTVMALESLK